MPSPQESPNIVDSPQDPPILRRLRERATRLDKRILLPEAEDPRILKAADLALRSGLCRPLLVGSRADVEAAATSAGLSFRDEMILDPAEDPRQEQLLERLAAVRSIPERERRAYVHDPLYYTNLLLECGDGDGAVMGAVATTGDTLRAAIRILGVDPRFTVVTSCFLMAWNDERSLIYADCGVVPKPTAEQLADIAVQAAEARRALVDDEPRVALLSFSTKGSANHESLDVVRRAVEVLEQRQVDFAFDGELQGDAALVSEIAGRKAPDSRVAGSANVLIFPDLNSGNIAYKLTERLAGARAVGPLLQGLTKPVHDLSRGCSVNDILDTLAITALDAARQEGRTRT